MDSSPDTQLKSARILDELKRQRLNREIVDVEEQRVKIVVFICGANRYAFYGSAVREILPVTEIFWIPGLPDYLPGLINIRGDMESVTDIRHFLGEEPSRHGSGLIALSVDGDFRSAVMIDAIEDVVDIPVSSIRPPIGTLHGPARTLVCGETQCGGGAVTLLDIGKLASLITV